MPFSNRPTWATDTNFSSGPRSGLPTKLVPPAPGQGLVAGATIPANTTNWILNALTVEDAEVIDDLAAGRFGDGSDGNVTIAAGTTTLTRAMFYGNLTVTGTLRTRGNPVFVRGVLTGSGTIDARGEAGVLGVSGGVPGGASSWERGTAGATGTVAAVDGDAGTNATNSLGGSAGAGGAGSAPPRLAGAAGVATAVVESAGGPGVWRALDRAVLGRTLGASVVVGGAGGGSGAGGVGGAGGGGGDVLGLIVHTWGAFDGIVTARGGAGGNGTTNGGGGGGGGGGVIVIVARRGIVSLTDNGGGEFELVTSLGGVTPSPAQIIVRGGAAGAGIGNGLVGAAGSAGALYLLQG